MDKSRFVYTILAFIIFAVKSVTPQLAANALLKRETTMENIEKIFSKFSTTTKGKGTYYGKYPEGSGACSLDPFPPIYNKTGWIHVAAGRDIFQKSLGCGMCLEVKGEGEGSVGPTPMKGIYKAVVVDLCGCSPGLDFFTVGDGKWDITYKAIDCPMAEGDQGNIIFRMSGSNPWYIKIQVANARIPTASLEIFRGDRWYCAKRTADNFFAFGGRGKLSFPLRVRVTSIAGETLGATIENITEQDIKTDIQYKPFSEASAGKPKLQCYGQSDATALNANFDDDQTDATALNGASELKLDEDDKSTGGGKKSSTTYIDNKDKGGQTEVGKEETLNTKEWCRDNKKPEGTYADAFDCTGFIQCLQGNTYTKKCPPGQRFNPKIMNCDRAEIVVCDNRRRQFIEDSKNDHSKEEDITPTPVLSEQSWCSRHQKKDGLYPDPSDCSGFIHCLRGRAFIKKCPPNTAYSLESSSCENEKVVECSTRSSISSNNKVQTSTTNIFHEKGSEGAMQSRTEKGESPVIVDTTPALKNDNSNTSESDSGDQLRKPLNKLQLPEALRKIAKSIEIGDVNLSNNSQDLPERASNNGGMSKDGTPINANLTSSNFCSGRFDGHYYVPDKCENYYICSRGRTFIKSCPSSLLFNAKINACDVQQKVDCKNRLGDTATSHFVEELNNVD